MTRIVTEREPGFIHTYSNTEDIDTHLQILAWRDWVGRFVDTPPSREQVERGFKGRVDFYSVNDLMFLHSHTGELKLDRSIGRISVDSARTYVFHVVLTGGVGRVDGLYRNGGECASLGIVALDMNQPFHMHRPDCRLFNVFAPRELVESELPDAESIHGRIIQDKSPLFRLIYEYLIAFDKALPTMGIEEADAALRVAIRMIVAAFGKQSKLSGNARAAVRTALFGHARRYIVAHLDEVDLTPERVVAAMQLPRATLYRMFDHEGGIGEYIRNQRLRQAADDLMRFPLMAVMDVAFGAGFDSPQDFSRAFRRSFGMTPMDFREEIKRRRIELALGSYGQEVADRWIG